MCTGKNNSAGRIGFRYKVGIQRYVCCYIHNNCTNGRLYFVTGVEPGQLDAEMAKTLQHMEELQQRLEELKQLQDMRESIARNKNFLKLSNVFAEDK